MQLPVPVWPAHLLLPTVQPVKQCPSLQNALSPHAVPSSTGLLAQYTSHVSGLPIILSTVHGLLSSQLVWQLPSHCSPSSRMPFPQ